VEEHFYLVFPCLAWWLTRRPSTGKFIGVCLAVLIGGMTLRWSIWTHWLAPVIHQDAYNARFLEGIYYPTWSRLDGLLAGVMLATIKIYRQALWARLQTHANGLMLLGLFIVACAIALFRDRAGLLSTVIGYPLLSSGLAFVVMAGSSTQSWLGKLKIPGAGWLALTSYSLYLSHKAVLHLADNLLGAQLAGHTALAFFVYALAVLMVGGILYYAVEQPFLKLRERLSTR
jgi:peptidoglycan/LPS O-acetylase OafA/YrhL